MTRVRRLAKKPIFLPEFVVTLIRTPFLPPRYATFYVPLEFNKLDMREYMKQLYNVDIISIRSVVEQQKVTRERRDGGFGHGPLRRPKSKKKMTIEMREPFVWPEAPEDKSAWQPDQFYRLREHSQAYQEASQPSAAAKPVKDEAETFENQAKALGLKYDRPALAKLHAEKPKEVSAKETKEETREMKETKETKEEALDSLDEMSSSSSVDSTSPEHPKKP
uniref:Large ribosomal subunit protein uL23m n=1 Tax=Talaromyces marneffei PM1 TaxID=1077442 RepID=A0A093Y6Q7_TALMA